MRNVLTKETVATWQNLSFVPRMKPVSDIRQYNEPTAQQEQLRNAAENQIIRHSSLFPNLSGPLYPKIQPTSERNHVKLCVCTEHVETHFLITP